MFRNVFFDISGVCNAKCEWCQTGKNNKNKITTGKFVDIDEFKKSIFYMLENGFINRDSVIALFNWGEPFLHPEFKEIIKFLDKENIKFSLSTNASKLVLFENQILKNLQWMTISMSGFSQKSYDKIHGFDFLQIKENIVKMANNFRENGFKGNILISYHVYQFNMHELEPMIQFAIKNSFIPQPYFAFFNDFERFRKYIKSELDYSELKKATEQLILYYVDEQLKSIPEHYVCEQYSCLAIDSYCNVITCCCNSNVLDKIYNLKPEDINDWRINSAVCRDCNKIGQSYVMNTPTYYKLGLNNDLVERYKRYCVMYNNWVKNIHNQIYIYNYLKENNLKSVSIYGIGEVAKILLEELRGYDVEIDSFICKSLNIDESKLYENIPVIRIENVSEIKSDAILVTPIYDFENIKDEMINYGCKSKIINLESIVSTIFQGSHS